MITQLCFVIAKKKRERKKLKATEQYGNGGILVQAASGRRRHLGASLWLPDVERWRAPAVLQTLSLPRAAWVRK